MEKTASTGQYLSFCLDGEKFAIDISRVREVLDYTRITRVPQTPDFMEGVINLRGSVVPVVDLKAKFALGRTERTVNTRIIIGEVEIDGEVTVIGALADSVHEVVEIEAGSIEPAPKLGTRLNTNFLKGMGKQDDEFIMILDMDRVFSLEEISVLAARNSPGEAVGME